MSKDHWFNGFPCEWNMIVPTLYLLRAAPWFTTVACIALALTQLTNWKFVHPMQVRRFRPLTVTVTVVWLATVLWMTAESPGNKPAARHGAADRLPALHRRHRRVAHGWSGGAHEAAAAEVPLVPPA